MKWVAAAVALVFIAWVWDQDWGDLYIGLLTFAVLFIGWKGYRFIRTKTRSV